jgi:2'-hydroxyisoflavone reductase
LHILLLGGTRFLGRHVVAALLARDHAVTLFTRGRTAPELFAQEPRVSLLRGDRDGDLAALDAATRARRFEAVVDTCGYLPRVVAASCRLLRERADIYLFVSSISAYAEMNAPNMTEDAPLAVLDDPASEDVAKHYGALKAACEREVRREFGDARALVVRPGLIVGPHDPSGRFTYWPLRLAAGGDVLAPEPRDAPVQLIDVRDLAAWLVSLLERRIAGVFNATGPQLPLRFDEMLNACAAAVGSAARLVWMPAAFLLEHKVAPWTELPLWLAGEEPGLSQIDVGRALAQGLHLRELRETAADTLRWARDAGVPLASDAAGLRPQREAELLALWRRRSAA